MPNDVNVKIHGTDELTPAVKTAQGSVGLLGSSLSEVGKIASGVFAAQLASAGLNDFTSLLKDSVSAAVDAEAAQRRLQVAAEATGATWDDVGPKLREAAEAGVQMGFSMEHSRSALSKLLTETNDVGAATRDFAVAQDLARGAAISLEAASRLVGKMDEGKVTALNRLGIIIDANATREQAYALIEQRFHGQALAYAETSAGAMARTSAQLEELKVRLGQELLPVMGAGLKAVVFGFAELNKAIDNTSAIVKVAAGDVKFFGDKLGLTKNSITDSASALKMLTSFYGENSDQVKKFKAALDGQTTALEKDDGAAKAAAESFKRLVDAQLNSIRAESNKTKASEEAWATIIKENKATDAAAIAEHNLAEAKKGTLTSGAEYTSAINAEVVNLKNEAAATNFATQAKLVYNASIGVMSDVLGNAIPTQQQFNDKLTAEAAQAAAAQTELIKHNDALHVLHDSTGKALETQDEFNRKMDDSKLASDTAMQHLIAYNNAHHILQDTLGNTIKTFAQLVEEQKQSILQSQEMAKATAEANRELGIMDTSARTAASSVSSLSTAESTVKSSLPAVTPPTGGFDEHGNKIGGGSSSSGGSARPSAPPPPDPAAQQAAQAQAQAAQLQYQTALKAYYAEQQKAALEYQVVMVEYQTAQFQYQQAVKAASALDKEIALRTAAAQTRLAAEQQADAKRQADVAAQAAAISRLSSVISAAPHRASGGPASGLTWVGEYGPELARLPGGSTVMNADDSRSIANGRGVEVHINGPVHVHNEGTRRDTRGTLRGIGFGLMSRGIWQ